MELTKNTTTRSRIFRNASWNWIGICCEAIVGFLLLPILLSRLGDTNYGIWVIIGAFAGYFQILDLGMRGSVGRFVAFYHAREDVASINRVISTAVLLLALAGAIAASAVIIGSFLLPMILDIAAEVTTEAQLAMMLVGIHLGLWFLSRTFDAVLWGYQRFDLLNVIDTPAAFIRLALCWTFVTADYGLVKLSIITVGMTIAVGVAKAWLSFQQEQHLSISFRAVDRTTVGELFGFGKWSFLANLATFSKKGLISLLIGSFLGPASVAVFSIARRLADYATMFVTMSVQVLTPVSASIAGRGDSSSQRSMFLKASRYSACLVAYFSIGQILLGESLIHLWVGDTYSTAAFLLTILVVGQSVALTAAVGRSVLQGVAKHESIAGINVCDAVFSTLGVLITGYYFGLLEVCIAFAISNLTFRGVIQLVFVCRLLKVSFGELLRVVFLPVIFVGYVPTGLVLATTFILPPTTWLAFFSISLLYSAAWFVCLLIYFDELRFGVFQYVRLAAAKHGWDTKPYSITAKAQVDNSQNNSCSTPGND